MFHSQTVCMCVCCCHAFPISSFEYRALIHLQLNIKPPRMSLNQSGAIKYSFQPHITYRICILMLNASAILHFIFAVYVYLYHLLFQIFNVSY